MKRLLVALALLLLAASPAAADNAAQVAAALRSSPVYQAAGVDLVDVGALTSELSGSSPRVYLAVLQGTAAANDTEARARAIEIGKALADTDSVVLVITASFHVGTGEGRGAAASGVDARAALAQERDGFAAGADKDAITAFVSSFAERVANQASSPQSGVSNDGSPIAKDDGGSGAGVLLGVVALAAVGGTAWVVTSSRRRRQRLNEGLRADVEQLYDRLGADVLNLDAGDNAVARQALADASERYSACGSQLAEADAPAEFAAARRTAVEGLTAARTARTALGLDPGPDVPLVPGDGPQLAGEQQVTVGGQSYDGSPEYAPGRQHYYGGGTVGGQQVLGGWYSGNFWEPFLLGSILTGGFGGGFGGGGFERGYDEGYDAGQQADSGGGDWGGGGGDWGGTGGDSGGGGDW